MSESTIDPSHLPEEDDAGAVPAHDATMSREAMSREVMSREIMLGESMPGELAERLRSAGLRPTRQRLALGALMFGAGDRHVSAEMLHAEALASGEHVSLATVYNTLHQFTEAGLLRELAIDGGKAFFDTNTSNHNHFFIESSGEVMDIPSSTIRVDGLPEPPDGMMISHIDVVVRLVPKAKT